MARGLNLLPAQCEASFGARQMHLYLHIPFCHRICPYCAFHKHGLAGYDLKQFVRALDAQAALVSRELAPPPIRTIHCGGGTPSLLKQDQFADIVESLQRHFDLSELEEFALEANPSTFDLAKAQRWQQLGVNRVSLGVQSFQRQLLQTLGRDHSPTQAARAFELLRTAAIPSVSLDLMFSLPGQTLDDWRADIHAALTLRPDHISAYNLTYEEDTDFLRRLRRGEFSPAPERDADCFELARKELIENGFEHYEISNYARSGHRSRHNQAYWRGADYLGLGPGAVSTWAGERWKNLPDTHRWTAALLAAKPRDLRVEREILGAESLRLERLALGLRTREGVAPELIGPDARATLPLLIEAGLIFPTLANDQALRLTPHGMALADEISLQLV